MEIRLVNYEGTKGEPVLIIRRSTRPKEYIEVEIGDKLARVNTKELAAAVEAVSK